VQRNGQADVDQKRLVLERGVHGGGVVEPELRGGRGGLVRVTAEHHHLDVSRAAYAAAWAWPNPVPNRAIFMIIVPFELDGYMVRSVRQRRGPRVSISATSAALRVSSRAWQFSEIRSG
jgi:hypothetical protein